MSDFNVLPLPPYTRTAGFRFSTSDALILTVGGAAALLLAPLAVDLAGLIVVVTLHFFLFCNVFRIHRRLELIWTVVFLLNAATVMLIFKAGWLVILALQAPITVALIASELRKPYYHGILAHRINPRVDQYMRGC